MSTIEEVKEANADQIRWIYVSWALVVGILLASLGMACWLLAIGGWFGIVTSVFIIGAAVWSWWLMHDKMSKGFKALADRAEQ